MSQLKDLLRGACPPFLWQGLQRAAAGLRRSRAGFGPGSDAQDLEVYWDPAMAEALELWGEGTTWSEIELLMADRRGRVLDIACGTGRTMSSFLDQDGLEVYGLDISDLLLSKATARGIPAQHLARGDATRLPYADAAFDWAYSIGSLEHFTDAGIDQFLRECHRVVRGASFHMVPTTRGPRDEGWVKTFQSFHNNTPQWWIAKCQAVYPRVRALPSAWSDQISVGRWLVCER